LSEEAVALYMTSEEEEENETLNQNQRCVCRETYGDSMKQGNTNREREKHFSFRNGQFISFLFY